MKYTKERAAELRKEAIRGLLLSGWWPSDVAAAFGISASTVYTHTKALREEGKYISKTNLSAMTAFGFDTRELENRS